MAVKMERDIHRVKVNSQFVLSTAIEMCGSVALRYGAGLAIRRSRVRITAVRCNPGQVVNTHVPVTKQHHFLLQANGRRCLVAGEVTVGLASHWPRVSDISGSPPTGSRPGRGR